MESMLLLTDLVNSNAETCIGICLLETAAIFARAGYIRIETFNPISFDVLVREVSFRFAVGLPVHICDLEHRFIRSDSLTSCEEELLKLRLKVRSVFNRSALVTQTCDMPFPTFRERVFPRNPVNAMWSEIATERPKQPQDFGCGEQAERIHRVGDYMRMK